VTSLWRGETVTRDGTQLVDLNAAVAKWSTAATPLITAHIR
jgi:hypothetical protein